VKYFEDFELGSTEEYGHYEVTREEVLDFAGKYDPQPFHLDDAAAAQTHFKKLCASGWHTCAMTMRMIVDNGQGKGKGEGSPGVSNIKWMKPVYPGDVLRVRSEIIEARPLKSRPVYGLVTIRHHTLNQDDIAVMSFDGAVLYRRRSAA